MKSFKLHEDVPTMSAGSGQIAGIGVGPDGEPGVDMRARKKKRTQYQQKAELHVPKELVPSGLTEEQTPLDVELWAAAQEMAKDEYPDHPTPESTKFAVDWYVKHGGEYASNTAKNEAVEEDLRKWFGKGKTGGIGGRGWDRYNTQGERIGKCGDAEDRGGEGEGKPKCLSKEKAAQLRAQGGKQAIANAVKRKKAQDPVTDRKGTGGAPRPVSNRIGESVLNEKNVPTNPELWSRAKSEAKKRFDVYPSAYANGWAAKWYKEHGGGWKSKADEAASPAQQAAIAIAMKKAGKTPKKESNTPSDREWGTDSLTKIYKMDTPGELEEAAKPSIHQIETGDRVKGRYMNQFPFTGKVYDQRPHSINHKIQIFYVKLDKPITVFGARRDSIVINASDDQYAAIRFSGGSGGDSIEKLKEAVALTELLSLSDAWEKITTCQQCKKKLSPRELKLGARVCDACIKKNKGKIWGKDSDDVYDEDVRWTDAYTTEDCGCDEPVKEALSVPKKPISRVVVDYMHGKAGGSMAQTRSVLAVSNLARPQARSESAVLAYLRKRHPKEEVILLNVDFLDSSGKPIGESVQPLEEAEYQGRKVTLNDPFRSSDGKHKFYVYVQNDKGNVIKLGFGDPNLSIKRDDPERRKNFLARHNCSDPGPKWKAKYWSCKWGWGKKSISDRLEE